MRTRSSRPSGHACPTNVALRLYRGTDGILRASERYEESVPLRVDLVTTVPCDHVAQEPAVALKCVPVSISAQFLEKLGRPLDVRKEERNSPDGEIRHRGTPPLATATRRAGRP